MSRSIFQTPQGARNKHSSRPLASFTGLGLRLAGYWCLASIAICLFGQSIVLGAEKDLAAQIHEFLQSTEQSEAVDWDGTEGRLLDLLDEDSTSAAKAKVYMAIAQFYGRNAPDSFEKRADYARKALENELGLIEACNMYICLTGAVAAKYWRKRRGDRSPEQISEQVMPALEGLAFTLKHLRINTRQELPMDGFYSPQLSGSEYREAVRRHQEAQAARMAIDEQNRLLFYRMLFARQVMRLISKATIASPAFEETVHAAVPRESDAEKVNRYLRESAADDIASWGL